jgi:hypothetical protein
MPTITLPPRCDRAAAEALLPELVAALGAGAMQIDGTACTQWARPCSRFWSAPAAAATAR